MHLQVHFGLANAKIRFRIRSFWPKLVFITIFQERERLRFSGVQFEFFRPSTIVNKQTLCLQEQLALPSRPKLLQKKPLQRECFGAINLQKLQRITLQRKFLGLFSCKKGHASGSNITKKIFGSNYVCNNYKNDYKLICSKELFCNNFGQDGTPPTDTLFLMKDSCVDRDKSTTMSKESWWMMRIRCS